MKKIITTVMALTLALGMSVTALAAPSSSQGVGTDEKDKVKVEILPGAPADVNQDVIDGALITLNSEGGWDVQNKTSIPTADAEAAEKAALAGATDKDANVISYGDVTVNEDVKTLVNAGYIAVTLPMTLTGITAADNGNIIALVYYDGKWNPMKTEVVGDGRVNVTFTHFSPVAFVQLSAKSTTTPTTPATYDGWKGVDMAALWAAQTKAGATSPKTGDAGVLGFALVAVACGAALVFTKKKFA